MKQSHKANSLWETLIVIGLILLIPLFFAIKTMANSRVVSNTPMPAMTTAANPPADSNALKPKQPPACTFPLAQITAEESMPEEYTFSEPQVVLTAPEGNIYHLIQWLPDNQQTLIVEDLYNTYVFQQNDSILQQSIELFNFETGEARVYATRSNDYEPPAWSPDLNGIVYPAQHYTNVDKKRQTYQSTNQIWVSYGDPNTTQLIADNLTQHLFAIQPVGSEMMYLSDKQVSKLDKAINKLSSAPFDIDQWDYKERGNKSLLIPYHVDWRPGTSEVFLYSDGYGSRGGYTFILNADNGHICELNLGGWVGLAQWSSDGRYLALARATSAHTADLALLDPITGALATLQGTPQGMSGQLYLDDFIWSPDNRHLLGIGGVHSPDNIQANGYPQGLYLVDISSGHSVDITPANFLTNSPQSLAWSPDGSKLLVRCPIQTIDKICLISVQQTGE